MGEHLKYFTATGHLVKNENDHLVNACLGSDECGCVDGTLATSYRITVPADTFTGNCAAFFNGSTFDVDDQGSLSTSCCRSVDISGLGCAEEGSGSSVTACFGAAGVTINFSTSLGEGVNFSFTNPTYPAAFDCNDSRTADFESNGGTVGGIVSTTGKTVSIQAL